MKNVAPEIAGVIQGDLPGQVALREWVEKRADYWARAPRGTCETCGATNELLGDGDPRCAECRRRTSNRRQGELSYPCDQCGRDGAIRDPAHRRDEYLCLDCHKLNGYEPGERAMVFKTAARVGVTHSLGRRIVCILSSSGTPCGGEVKQRSNKGLICNRHWNPVKYDANKGS